MPRTIELDFTGAPPEQGGGRDYFPPGKYAAYCRKCEAKSSKAGRPMIEVVMEVGAGDHKGKSVTDYFIINDPEKKFGMKRLHAFFLAFGLPIAEKKLKLDLDVVINKPCMIEVADEKQEATDQYQERINTKIRAYHVIQREAVANKNGVTPVAEAPAPAPAPAPPAPAPTEPEPVEEITEIAAAPVAAAPAASVGTPQEVEDLDDLFK